MYANKINWTISDEAYAEQVKIRKDPGDWIPYLFILKNWRKKKENLAMACKDDWATFQ